MELTTIEMDKGAAMQAFRSYRDEVRLRHDEELVQIMRGYRELAKGNRLIHLGETVKAGGTVPRTMRRWENGERVRRTVLCPALAVCKADEEFATFDLDADGSITFAGFKDHERSRYGDGQGPGHNARVRRVALPRGTVDAEGVLGISEGRFEAMVPIVPPPLRPRHHLRNYHVLFEADWKEPRRALAPRDPALLKRIGGDLFAVLAIWDLTDLERAVLSGRGRT